MIQRRRRAGSVAMVWWCAGAVVVAVVGAIAAFEWSNSTPRLQRRVERARRQQKPSPRALHPLQTLLDTLSPEDAEAAEEAADGLAWRARAGFDDENAVVELLAEALLDLNIEADPQVLGFWFACERDRGTSSAVRKRLDAAFTQLREEGLVALQHHGWDVSEGVAQIEMDHPDAAGAVFYPEQETRRAVQGLGLVLTVRGGRWSRERVGSSVTAALEQHGVPCEPYGSGRVIVLPFRWSG